MKKASSNLTYTDRFRFWTTRTHGGKSPVGGSNGTQPVDADAEADADIRPHPSNHSSSHISPDTKTSADHQKVNLDHPSHHHASGSHPVTVAGFGNSTDVAPGPLNTAVHGQVGQPSPQDASSGTVLNNPVQLNEKTPDTDGKNPNKPSIIVRVGRNIKKILLHSKINVLLIFVPVGIALAQYPEQFGPGLVFGINAVAIIPLAALLSHATESVARKLGDTIGALLNVTFGNAVELIILTALVKDEIRIVQASILGSILANLLLILGMAFLLGGLRFREQLYNSTVTQMSACLLSLSVSSLVLPTAFHWSFKEEAEADAKALIISRGTSVVLLLVYVMYLLFQLKSHAYMYQSTPQHIIDAESTPGPASNWLDSSSSDDDSSSSSDSDDSDHSRETLSRRIGRAMHVGRRRKSSVVSNDTIEVAAAPTRTPSFGTSDAATPFDERAAPVSPLSPMSSIHPIDTLVTDRYEEAVDDAQSHRSHRTRRHKHHRRGLRRYSRSKKHKSDKSSSHTAIDSRDFVFGEEPIAEAPEKEKSEAGEPRRVDFAVTDVGEGSTAEMMTQAGRRSPFNGLRDISIRPIVRSIAPSVFMQPSDSGNTLPSVSSGPVPRVRYGIRRTNSLPDRLNTRYHTNQQQHANPNNHSAMMPSQIPLVTLSGGTAAAAAISKEEGEGHDDLSRVSSIILLLITTGLVYVCADYMVDSIQGLVKGNAVGEVFIGLIILPVVGNAAEHVTAITVAMKNKMDLAIGVAVGSSIQIALFITPLIVILGWIIDRDMSLYFTLFETVCLFVSAFIVNFLVLDGRSNYLEGALLCATYTIIALVAFYYPKGDAASVWGA